MAQTTTLNMLTASSHTAPVGEKMTLTGTSVQAASYYVAGNSLQTFAWSFSNTFNADVFIEGTLDSTPTENDWFLIHKIDLLTKTGFMNFNGNFVLLRTRVAEWVDGNINFVSVSY